MSSVLGDFVGNPKLLQYIVAMSPYMVLYGGLDDTQKRMLAYT